jgi:hypothetical protein
VASSGERRNRSRFDKVFSVYITGAWGSGFGIARNISEGGMFIETLEPYPLGSKMEVIFSFPNEDLEMVATAEVVHLCFLNSDNGLSESKTKTGMGIRFISFVEEEQFSSPRVTPYPAPYLL